MNLDVRPLQGIEQARLCAGWMSSTDPWITLGRDFDECLSAITAPDAEVWIAHEADGPAAFILLVLQGPFAGYVRTLCVSPQCRGRGVGSELLAWAEARIYRDFPNVFLCVSSFNVRARSLYERLGYETIGELKDFVVRGHSEWLMRKPGVPWREFKPAGTAAPRE